MDNLKIGDTKVEIKCQVSMDMLTWAITRIVKKMKPGEASLYSATRLEEAAKEIGAKVREFNRSLEIKEEIEKDAM